MDLKKLEKALNLLENKLNEEDEYEASYKNYDSTNEQWAINEFKKLFTSKGMQAPNVKVGKNKFEETSYSPKITGVGGFLFKTMTLNIQAGSYVDVGGRYDGHSMIQFVLNFKYEHPNGGRNGFTNRIFYDLTDKKLDDYIIQL